MNKLADFRDFFAESDKTTLTRRKNSRRFLAVPAADGTLCALPGLACG
jgi:hypothetical protein